LRERKRESEQERERVCVCERERQKRKSERDSECERERERESEKKRALSLLQPRSLSPPFSLASLIFSVALCHFLSLLLSLAVADTIVVCRE